MTRRPFVTIAGALLLALPTAAAAQSAKAEQGAALFVSQKCTMCHSVAGKGNPKGSLDGIGAAKKPDEIKQWIVDPEGMRTKTNATRTPAMKAMKLSPDQIDALVAYLGTLKTAKATQ